MLDFAAIFHNSLDVGFMTDLRGAILAATRGAEKLLGYSQRELAGLDLAHLDAGEEGRSLFGAGAETRSRLRVELRLRNRSGRLCPIEAVASCLRDAAGAPAGWFLMGQDLRNAVAEARGQRTVLDALVDSIDAALWSFDAGGKVVMWSAACERSFGWPRAEVEGVLPAIRLFPSPEEYRRVVKAVDDQGRWSGEIPLLGREGGGRLYHLAVTRLAPRGGAGLGYSCVTFDVTERRRTEELFRALFEKANEGVFLVEGEGLRIIEANEETCRLLGYTREELLALAVPDIVPPDLRHRIESVRASMTPENPARRDRRFLLRKDGTRVVVDHGITRLELSGRVLYLASARDLTEQVRVEREREDAEAFLRCVMDGASDGVAVLDEQGRYVMVNRKLLELQGSRQEDLIGHSFEERTEPQDLESYRAFFAKLLRGEPVRMRTTVKSPERGEIPVDVNSTLVQLGGRKYVVALVREIAEQVREEEALQRAKSELERNVEGRTAELKASEERLRLLVNQVPALLWTTDRYLRFTSSRGAGLAALGLATDQVVGRTLQEFFGTRDPEFPALAFHARALEGMPGRFETDWAGRHYICNVEPLRDREGAIDGTIGLALDVTERRQAEAAIREAERRFQQVTENIHEVFYIAAPDWSRFSYVSPAYAEIWGRSCERLYADPMSWREGVHPGDRERVEKVLADHAGRGRPYSVEYRVLRPDGAMRWVLDRAYEIPGPDGRPFQVTGIIEDITERKRTEAEQQERAGRLIRRQSALVELTQRDLSRLEDAFGRITETAAGQLGVERASVWLYSEDRSALECRDLFLLAPRRHERGPRLAVADHPRYFRALDSSRTLAAADARSDPRTSEFADGYFRPLGITSMMDVPIRRHGRVVGVLCQEQVGPPREWTAEDQEFASTLADVAALALEASERRLAEERLRAAHDELERRVEERTSELAWANQLLKREIEERGRTAEDLKLFREIFAHATEGICLLDPRGAVLAQNRAHRELLGFPDEELLGREPEFVIPAMLDSPGGVHAERSVRTRSGAELRVEVSAFSVRNASGGVLCHVVIQRNISERRRTEEVLAFQKTLLESQTEAAIEGILVVSPEGRMISFNRRFVEMWGIPGDVVASRSDEAALASVFSKLADPEGFLSRVRHLYDHPDEKSQDEIRLKDGRTFDRYSAPIRSADGVLYGRVWYFRDVTGRKRTEEELRRAAEEIRKAYTDLQQAQERLIRSEKLASIGMLVSGVAHEINNPLNVMFGNLTLLGQGCREVTPLARAGARARKVAGVEGRLRRFKGMIRDALKAAQHARGIMEDFRGFARDVRTAEQVDLNRCLEETLALVQRGLPAGIRVVRRLRRIPPVRCVRGQMSQVFFNLLTNAAEALEKKGTITLRTARRDGQVVVEVADTGRGMSDEVRKKLFEPFFTTKPVGKGLGLGLSISATIVNNHGGRITVRSRPGRGSVFRVELPIQP